MYLKTAIAFFLAGIRGAVADPDCFCSVGETGPCGGSPYETIPTGYTSEDDVQARCQEFCFLQPDECKGFSTSGGNCYLYDEVPDSVDAGEEGSCFGMLGQFDGFVELPRRATGPCGGLCRAPIYSGKDRCDFRDYLEYPNCNEPGSYIAADTLQECKDWCEGRGNLCQGFDFDQGKADAGSNPLSCYERRYKPTEAAAPSSRFDYGDEFCHARVCACPGVDPPAARVTGFPEEECVDRTSRPTDSPTPPPTDSPTDAPTRTPCADDSEWFYIKQSNGRAKDCEWIGDDASNRCDKYGVDGNCEITEATVACPSACDPACGAIFD